MPRRIVPLALCLLALALALTPAAALACVSGYAYAGLVGEVPATSVAATVTAVAPGVVDDGHVAGWVNVGTSSGWLQAGINTTVTGDAQALYYEYRVPGAADPVYVPLGTVPLGESRRVAVTASGKDAWVVSVDGLPVSAPIYLNGSTGKWKPSALGEAFSRAAACQQFHYRFDAVKVTGARGAKLPLFPVADPGYRVVRANAGFDALAA